MARARRVILAALLTSIAVVFWPTELRAQSRNEQAVRAVVDSFFAAVAREQWDSAARLLDLPRFEPILKAQVSSARGALPQPPMTAEQYMATDSTMPRAVAEWEAARSNRFRAQYPFDDYSRQFAGVTSQHMLFSLTLPDAAARWIAAQDERVAMRDNWRRAGCGLGDLSSAITGALPSATHTILGIAFRDDSTAFVIHADDRYPSQMMTNREQIMPVHRTAAGWRIEARRDLLHSGNMSFAFGGCPKK